MGRKFRRDDKLCPECGQLMSKNDWNCLFCGWSSTDSQMYDFETDAWDDLSDWRNMPNIDDDLD